MKKERPIIFNGHDVRATLDGRKTQFRQVVKPQPKDPYLAWSETPPRFCDNGNGGLQIRCPFEPGDGLWVRETWRNSTDRDGYACINYRADDKALSALADSGGDGDWVKLGGEVEPMWKGRKEYDEQPWRPSVHMPRWASRITLEVTGVKVERLRDMTEEDAMAEGATCPLMGEKCSGFIPGFAEHEPRECICADGYVQLYKDILESMRGKGSWDTGPWMWVVGFKRI